MNQNLYQIIVIDRTHRTLRKEVPAVAQAYAAEGLSPGERMTRRFEWLCREQEPTFLGDEKICFLRTTKQLPDIFTEEEWDRIRKEHYIHELGYQSNLTVDFAKVLKNGLLCLKAGADGYGQRMIDALLGLTERYRQAARESARLELAEVLQQVPAYGARSFHEALQAVRIINFALWLEGDYHNTLGRFDQYLYPFLKHDLEAGILTKEEALELVEEFFLSLNRDSDLYPGVQQGDNGQSLMLGGRTKDGSYGFNELSEMCLTASRELKLIDPKINIRVDKDTPDSVYTMCSELTKVGLGFPQYSNDDVVIPGLIDMGYAPEDAVEYTVAACWEFIIPAVGRDVANIAAFSVPKAVDTCLHRDLPNCETAEAFYDALAGEIKAGLDTICSSINNLWFVPSPFLNLLMGEPKYQNFGIHNVGLSTAADSLTSIVEHVFDAKDVTVERLLASVDSDYEKDPELLHLLRFETPKLGTNSEKADSNLVWLLDTIADALEGKKNCCGGCYRAGTGSAMYYLWSAAEIGASPDGRRKGEAFAANYSISLFTRTDGPFSLLRSMTRPNLRRTINGGPLTIEFHDTIFKTPQAVAQVGQYVKQFILMGGHQLQLNAVNAQTLHDAQEHPEKYPQLIVRIWGWSAYFVELDRAYQDHVISRQEYSL